MSSILLNIYDALDAMTVTYVDKNGASVNPTCYNLNELPNSIQTEKLPCRLLLPIGQGVSGSTSMTIEHGAGVTANWQITDLFLLETAARGEGLYIHAPVLVRYVAAYAEAISKKWQILYQWQSEALVLNLQPIPGIYNFPSGSDAYFYGVKIDLNIQEIF